MEGGSSRLLSWLSVTALLLAVGYRYVSFPASQSRVEQVIQSLLRYEDNNKLLGTPRVAVGYGSCRDLFVPASVMTGSHAFPAHPQHHLEISGQSEFLEMFAYFFQAGAAAERFVPDGNFFNELVAEAQRHKEHRWALGGNAPVMAARFAREGAEVLLGAKLSPSLAAWKPSGIEVAGGTVDDDDIHLIMEYKREEKWGSVPSPRANRFIVHHDLNNPLVTSLEEFGSRLHDFSPDLLVVSGLQMMDNFPFSDGEREARVDGIREQMRGVNKATRIHFEMASFVDETLLGELLVKVVPYCDSLGMNEQELPNLHSLLTSGSVSYVSDSNPRIATVLDQMRAVYQLLSARAEQDGTRSLTRLHLHTLAYQAVMTKRGSWKNNGPAAVKASLTAHRHVCASSQVTADKSYLIMDDSFSTSREGGRRVPFDNERPLACWEEDDLDISICLAPVLVCAEAVQTAGGGDNISAAGLVMQL